MDEAEFTRLYGPWASRTPDDAREFFDGYPGIWWIAGGWVLEAFTGVARDHDDLDCGILLTDLPLIRAHVADRFHLWGASSGALKPVVSDDPTDLLEGTAGLWTRRSAMDPWEYDLLVSPGTRDEWVCKRDMSIRMPMSEALWERDGIRYLQPEIQLLYKAKGLRAKDQIDFDTTLPHLDQRRWEWLADALQRTLPGHPWLAARR